MEINLKGKVVVITGSSRGIGREIALRCALEGASVVINYLNSRDAAQALHKKIEGSGGAAMAVCADVRVQDQVIRLCRETIDRFGRVDILINNTGICSDSSIIMMNENQWDSVIDTNLKSVFLCSKIFSREMIKQNYGKIINISSLKGQLGSSGQTNYCASKAGIIGFTKALAKELGRYNISVNAVCPGFIPTDLNRHNEEKREMAERMSTLAIDSCLEDLLNFLVYMSSDSFKNISGRIFNLDSRLN